VAVVEDVGEDRSTSPHEDKTGCAATMLRYTALTLRRGEGDLAEAVEVTEGE
jgi:hypothetical protein